MRIRSSLSSSASATAASSSSSSWLTVFCLLWLVNSDGICAAASLELSEGGSPSSAASAASHRNRLLSALLSYHGNDDAIILELPVSILDNDPPEVVMISDDRHWLPVLETEVPLDGRLMEEGQHLQQQQQQQQPKRRQRMMGHAVARRTFDTLGGAEIPWIY